MKGHGLRQDMIREWMAPPEDKRQTEDDIQRIADASAVLRLTQASSCKQLISEKVRSPSCASGASIGNSRANVISESEPSYEPDCESHCEVWHDRP